MPPMLFDLTMPLLLIWVALASKAVNVAMHHLFGI
jgi:hypothetical protein